MVPMTSWICPPSRSFKAQGRCPLYGTCVILVPAHLVEEFGGEVEPSTGAAGAVVELAGNALSRTQSALLMFVTGSDGMEHHDEAGLADQRDWRDCY